MPYDSSSKIITRPLNTADISQATAEGSLDVGTLCRSGKINPFAKFKPINHTAIGEVTDAQRLTGNFGLAIPAVTTPAQLLNNDGTAAVSWVYTARTQMYRMFDFTSQATSTYGYYKEAPVPMTCVVRSEGWSINAINEAADQNARIPFYVWFRSAVELGDKMIDESIGTNGNYNHSAAQLGSSISADELSETTSGSQLMPVNGASRFGIALFTKSGSTYSYHSSYLCTQPISVNSTYANPSDPDYPYAAFNLYANHCLNLSGNLGAITHGRYKAVPFLRVGPSGSYKYVPLAKYPLSNGSVYPCVFDFGMGMEDTYATTFRLGSSSTAPATPPSSAAITTTSNTIYAYAYVSNNSPWTHVTNGTWNGTTLMYETIDRWKLFVRIYANNSLTVGGTTVNFDRTNVTTTRISPSAFTIAPNGTAVLVYRIDGMFWSENGTTSITPDNGSAVMVGFTLSYLNTDQSYTQIGIQSVSDMTVYYG